MRTRRLGIGATVAFLTACTPWLRVEVNPSNCLNPADGNPAGECIGGIGEARLIEVRLFQLKKEVDACALDWNLFHDGKDADALKGALVDSRRSDLVTWPFKTSPGSRETVGSLEILPGASYILAVAVGNARGHRSMRLIPLGLVPRSKRVPLYLRGYDICLNGPCETTMEEKCQ